MPPYAVEKSDGYRRGDDADRWLAENDLRYDPKLKTLAVKRIDSDSSKWVLVDVDIETCNPEQRIVYFLQAASGGAVKIGSSKARMLPIRLRNLRSGSPERLEIRRTILGNAGLEHALHRHFAHLRIRDDGEWFNLDDELVLVSRGLTASAASGTMAAK